MRTTVQQFEVNVTPQQFLPLKMGHKRFVIMPIDIGIIKGDCVIINCFHSEIGIMKEFSPVKLEATHVEKLDYNNLAISLGEIKYMKYTV